MAITIHSVIELTFLLTGFRTHNSILLIIIAIIGFVMSVLSTAWICGLQIISLLAILGLILFIGQLALLGASSGIYPTAEKALDLLPAFPS